MRELRSKIIQVYEEKETGYPNGLCYNNYKAFKY